MHHAWTTELLYYHHLNRRTSDTIPKMLASPIMIRTSERISINSNTRSESKYQQVSTYRQLHPSWFEQEKAKQPWKAPALTPRTLDSKTDIDVGRANIIKQTPSVCLTFDIQDSIFWPSQRNVLYFCHSILTFSFPTVFYYCRPCRKASFDKAPFKSRHTK